MPEFKIDYDMFTDDEFVVTANGKSYKVEFELDLDANPNDADCYNPEDITAWQRDEWYYVGVTVTPLDVPEAIQFGLSDALWGLEFDFPLTPAQEINGRTYRDTGSDYQIMVYPVPGMIDEVAARVAAWEDSINRLAGFKVR